MAVSYSLNQLNSFVVLAEELHFGRAAERLQMTQPPLTRQIQRLEQSLGFSLLERSTRNVRLTAAGDAFLSEGRRLLSMAQGAPDRAKKIASGDAGHIAVGFTATSTHSGLVPLLRLLEEEVPGVKLSLNELVSSDQVEAVLSGAVDIGLVREPSISTELAGHLVHQEPLVFALPLDHRLAAEVGSVSVLEVEGESVIGYSHVGSEYFAILARNVLAGVRTNASLTATQIHTALALVSAHRGIALVPESAERLARNEVAFRHIAEYPEPVVELYAIWRRDVTNPALARVVNSVPKLLPFNSQMA